MRVDEARRLECGCTVWFPSRDTRSLCDVAALLYLCWQASRAATDEEQAGRLAGALTEHLRKPAAVRWREKRQEQCP